MVFVVDDDNAVRASVELLIRSAAMQANSLADLIKKALRVGDRASFSFRRT